MGTRHMIGVVVDGDFKVAQYGQWDGYPSGQGADVLNFCMEGDLDALRENARKLRWTTAEDEQAVKEAVGLDDSGWMNMEQAERYKELYPALSRDVGADILRQVAEGGVEFVTDSRDFALDSLFCEWAYVIDLDSNTLECYRGFNKELPTTGRWAGRPTVEEDEAKYAEHVKWCAENEREPWMSKVSEYKAIDLVVTFELDKLPELPEFIQLLDPVDEDELV